MSIVELKQKSEIPLFLKSDKNIINCKCYHYLQL